jgi:predicted cupin superfamily sugar epimerase
MHARAAHLVQLLRLEPHPEGGFFRQLFRSSEAVTPADGRGTRTALTTIYFLLPGNDVSRWHRVASDEVWHFYEGAPLEIWTATPDFSDLSVTRLGTVAAGDAAPVTVVRAGWWQAARPTGDYTLVGCTVAPGFEFDDFVLARDRDSWATALRTRYPESAELL